MRDSKFIWAVEHSGERISQIVYLQVNSVLWLCQLLLILSAHWFSSQGVKVWHQSRCEKARCLQIFKTNRVFKTQSLLCASESYFVCTGLFKRDDASHGELVNSWGWRAWVSFASGRALWCLGYTEICWEGIAKMDRNEQSKWIELKATCALRTSSIWHSRFLQREINTYDSIHEYRRRQVGRDVGCGSTQKLRQNSLISFPKPENAIIIPSCFRALEVESKR